MVRATFNNHGIVTLRKRRYSYRGIWIRSDVRNRGSHGEGTWASASIWWPVLWDSELRPWEVLCETFGIPIKAAALQFSLAHPASVAVIPGASKPQRIVEDHLALNTTVPDDFWYELRKAGLISPNAPLPIDHKQGVFRAVS
jgi:hypothetical protein